MVGKPEIQVNTTHNNLLNTNDTAVQVLAPQVKATQDANGNVNLNVAMNVHSADMRSDASIRSNVNMG